MTTPAPLLMSMRLMCRRCKLRPNPRQCNTAANQTVHTQSRSDLHHHHHGGGHFSYHQRIGTIYRLRSMQYPFSSTTAAARACSTPPTTPTSTSTASRRDRGRAQGGGKREGSDDGGRSGGGGGGGSCSVWADAEVHLRALEEVKEADRLGKGGRYTETVPLLQRAVKICTATMGERSTMTLAAMLKLAMAHVQAVQLTQAENVLGNFLDQAWKSGEEGELHLHDIIPSQLNLCKVCLFQGKIDEALKAVNVAVSACESDENCTPDTGLLGRALRHRGVVELISGDVENSETSLLRAARLSDTPADSAIGLSLLATWHFVHGSMEEAKDYWDEALSVVGGESSSSSNGATSTSRSTTRTATPRAEGPGGGGGGVADQDRAPDLGSGLDRTGREGEMGGGGGKGEGGGTEGKVSKEDSRHDGGRVEVEGEQEEEDDELERDRKWIEPLCRASILNAAGRAGLIISARAAANAGANIPSVTSSSSSSTPPPPSSSSSLSSSTGTEGSSSTSTSTSTSTSSTTTAPPSAAATVLAAKSSDRLSEALRIREQDLNLHYIAQECPMTSYTLGLLARSYHVGGIPNDPKPVTSEGLYRSALDKLARFELHSSHTEGVGGSGGASHAVFRKDTSVGKRFVGSDGGGGGGVPDSGTREMFSLLLAPYLCADVMEWYGELLLNWDKREKDGSTKVDKAQHMRRMIPLKSSSSSSSSSSASSSNQKTKGQHRVEVVPLAMLHLELDFL